VLVAGCGECEPPLGDVGIDKLELQPPRGERRSGEVLREWCPGRLDKLACREWWPGRLDKLACSTPAEGTINPPEVLGEASTL